MQKRQMPRLQGVGVPLRCCLSYEMQGSDVRSLLALFCFSQRLSQTTDASALRLLHTVDLLYRLRYVDISKLWACHAPRGPSRPQSLMAAGPCQLPIVVLGFGLIVSRIMQHTTR
jgi:hypothetical protein